jgi:hypothetical protein
MVEISQEFGYPLTLEDIRPGMPTVLKKEQELQQRTADPKPAA